jgi:hypothetical protein
LEPEIVIAVPGEPEFADKFVIAGGAYWRVAASKVTFPIGSLLTLVYLIRNDCPGPAALKVIV